MSLEEKWLGLKAATCRDDDSSKEMLLQIAFYGGALSAMQEIKDAASKGPEPFAAAIRRLNRELDAYAVDMLRKGADIVQAEIEKEEGRTH